MIFENYQKSGDFSHCLKLIIFIAKLTIDLPHAWVVACLLMNNK